MKKQKERNAVKEELETLRNQLWKKTGEERNGMSCQLTDEELSLVTGGKHLTYYYEKLNQIEEECLYNRDEELKRVQLLISEIFEDDGLDPNSQYNLAYIIKTIVGYDGYR